MLALASSGLAAETSVTIGGHIPGTLSIPDRATGKVPAVLLLHGFASSKDEVGDMYKNLAAKLAAQGIASLRIDFQGSGASTVPSTSPAMIPTAARTAAKAPCRQPTRTARSTAITIRTSTTKDTEGILS